MAANDVLQNLVNMGEKLVRVLAAGARGPARLALSDVGALDPDSHGYGAVIALHASLGASNGGTDVQFDTNPDYDIGVYEMRASCETGTAENTANSGGAVFNAAHCAVKIHDQDKVKNLTNSKSPCAGSAGGIDLNLLGVNGGQPLRLPVPYVFGAKSGTSTITATFATDASWPGTRRVGVALVAVYRRRGRQDSSI